MPPILPACMALAERRYRRNRSVRFYRHLARTGSAFPRLPRRFAPRNDNLGECRGALAPLHGLIPLYKALTARKGHAASVRRQSRQRLRSERRYRRKRSVRFFGSRYGTAVPSRDCHVGLRPPRNDKPVSLALSAFHFQLSIFHSRLPLPCNSPHKGPQTVKKPVQPKISEGRKV